jgi:hypothetical protein
MFAYILIFSLNLFAIEPDLPYYSNSELEAAKHAQRAIVKYYKLDKKLKTFEKKHINPEIKEYILWPAVITKIINDRYISYTWEF